MVYETPKKGCFGTSPWSLQSLVNEFGLQVDYAADLQNRCLLRFIDKEHDALNQEWQWDGWLNPPYEEQGAWIEHAINQVIKWKITIVMLLWVHTEAKYFQEQIMQVGSNNIRLIGQKHKTELRYIRGKVRYWNDGKPDKDRAFFGSCIAIARAI